MVGDQLDSWLKLNPTLPDQIQATAAKLVQDGVLTTFHVKHLMSGKYKGFVIGQYKVLEQIGAGGMGVIFLAEHMSLRRRVAIKVLPGEKAADPESLERFYREARVVAALDHPNIVRAYDVSRSGSIHYIVMEYIDGESLEQLVRRKGTLAVEEAADCISQAASGLQHAHERGLVHRDIKPGNLLMDKTGVLKVLDMGLARFFQDNSTLTMNLGNGAAIGTADYMAPEQGVNSHDVDIRADIYSLGVTFYTLLTGKPPFADQTITQKLVAHHMRDPISIRKACPDISAEFAAVVAKMMAKKPKDRFQEPQEVVAALSPWATQRFIPAPTTMKISGTRPNLKPVQLPKKKIRWLVPAIAGSVLGMAIVVAIIASGGRSPATETPVVQIAETNSDPVESTIPLAEQTKIPAQQTQAPALPPKDQPTREVGRFVGHADKVERMALSPDGTRMLTCGENSLKFWDVATTSVIHELKGHTENVKFVAFDKTGKKAVSSSFDGTIRIWNLANGRETQKLSFPGAKFWSAVFTPDGRHIFSGSKDGIARLWTAETGQIVRNMDGHTKDINWVAVSGDGATGYTASWDGSCRLWDLNTGEEAAKFDKQGASVNTLALSSDGRLLATGGGSKLCILDPALGYEIRSISAPDMKATYAIAFSADNRFVAAAGTDKLIRLWDVVSGKLLDTFGEHTQNMTALAFLPDGKHLISTSYDKTVRKWAIADQLTRYRTEEPKPGELRRFDTRGEQVERLALSPSGNVLAGGSRQGSVRMWDVETGRVMKEIHGHTGTVWFVAFSPSGRLLASASADGTVRIWNTVTWKEVHMLSAPKGGVWSVVFSPDGKLLLTGGDDGIGRIWSVETGDLIRVCDKHAKAINWVAWSPDGKMVYTAGWDGSIRGLDPATGKTKFNCTLEKRFNMVTISADGTMLLCASDANNLHLLDAKNGQKVRTFSDAKMSSQWSAMISADGLSAVSTGSENTVRVWNVTTGTRSHLFEGHTDKIPGCVISPDGKRVISTSMDKTMRMWVVPGR